MPKKIKKSNGGKQFVSTQQHSGPSDRVTMVAAVAIVLIVLVTLHSNSKRGCDYIISGNDFSALSETEITSSRTTLSGQAYEPTIVQENTPSPYIPQKHMPTQWKPACSDGIDNDRDGAKDYGKDKECSSTQDNTEEITQ